MKLGENGTAGDLVERARIHIVTRFGRLDATRRNGFDTPVTPEVAGSSPVARWQTRAGEIEWAIPKLRRGSDFPTFLEPRKPSEQAFVSVVHEAYDERRVAGCTERRAGPPVASALSHSLAVTPLSVAAPFCARTGARTRRAALTSLS